MPKPKSPWILVNKQKRYDVEHMCQEEEIGHRKETVSLTFKIPEGTKNTPPQSCLRTCRSPLILDLALFPPMSQLSR